MNTPNWSKRFAKRTQGMKPSIIREILKLTQKPDVISFAGGLPAPNLFPVKHLQISTGKILQEKANKALQYSTTEGYFPLREWIANQTPKVVPEQVQIISGSQQALDLVGKILLNPNDKIVVTSPTYMGALRAFDTYEVTYIPVTCDEQGILTESLEAALSQNPKLIYVTPNFDNPTSVTMSLARRESLINLASKYDTAILEDDPYGKLRFAGQELPSLYELAPQQVIYTGTFSKTLAPGFRLAWLIANPEVIELIVRAKQASDLHTPTFTQYIAYEVTKNNFMVEHIEKERTYYHNQYKLMLAAIEKHFPTEIHWTKPQGGMFLWVTLPVGNNTTLLLDKAIEKKVAYVPGEPFHVNGGGENTLRLSYSKATEEEINTGIERLGEVIKQNLK